MKVKAVDYAHDGRGVVKTGKDLVFVPNLMIGEEAEITITSNKKNYSIGEVKNYLSLSKERVTPSCMYYQQCGGCQLQHMAYEHQLEMKQKRVSDALKHIAKLYVPVDDIIKSTSPFEYRNKIQMAFANSKTGLIAGFYQAKTKKVLNINTCLIEHEEGNQVIQTLKTLLDSYHVKAYDPITKKGWIKHAVIKKGIYTNELMLIIISQTEGFKKQPQIISALIQKHPNIKTIIHQVNPSIYKVIGNKDNIIFGDGFIHDTLGEFTFKIRPQSFYQVNPLQAKKLYDIALDLAQINKKDTVLDAYCGVGTISLFAAKKAKHVTGVELIEDAVSDANYNASLNHMDNVRFVCDDAETFMASNHAHFDIVIVDPPRDGLQLSFIEAIKVTKPKKVVYISCEPSSLARDLKELKTLFHVKKVVPVDMFSQTYHVESVTLLELK
ncbi:MAG TPA: 23S rRNA (uracil(1939)-C(5))-methyltransferase RlmD [Acholeplasmataceae bacterium]|nr:23S rRNA (uracil(1939)-C(5))-methyltransferase RlmD [Acholeplasmataceae bacterium]